MKKSTITLVLSVIVFTTFAQGVYDDFIYTRQGGSDSIVPFINAKRVEQPQSELLTYQSELASKLSKLLLQEKTEELITMLSETKIEINDIDDFRKQVEDFRHYFQTAIALDCQKETNGTDKTVIYYVYAHPEGNGQHLYYRLYFVFHHQGEETKSLDIMFVKLPKNMGTNGVYDDYINTEQH